MSEREHKRKSPKNVPCAVITCSDTRTLETDGTGRLIVGLLEKHGHRVLAHEVVRDEAPAIRKALEAAAADPRVRAVILSGGTGIAPRDGTIEVLDGLLEKKMPGFGELFRVLSFQEIGSSAMLSRAAAGTWRGKIVFALPGSEGAARLALERLILPELGHMVFLLGGE